MLPAAGTITPSGAAAVAAGAPAATARVACRRATTASAATTTITKADRGGRAAPSATQACVHDCLPDRAPARPSRRAPAPSHKHTAVERRPNVAGAANGIRPGVVDAAAVLAEALGQVERLVGVGDELVAGRGVVGERGDADAHGHAAGDAARRVESLRLGRGADGLGHLDARRGDPRPGPAAARRRPRRHRTPVSSSSTTNSSPP